MRTPKVSIVIATLNAEKVLKTCLKYISEQDYPKDKIELIIADGGSVDGTLDLAKKYGAKVVVNKLKTGEAGKAVGVRAATGDFIALIDSDNYMVEKTWLSEMIAPLVKHPEYVGSEPWEYTWRKEDGFIDRYCALIGMNDPLVLFLGNYDRKNLLTGKWTEVEHLEKDLGKYLLLEFSTKGLPTIGANGTIFRADYLKKELGQDKYLFDIDILAKTIKRTGRVNFIKVKNGIVHAYCGSDVGKFARKQRRRVRDFLYHRFEAKDRHFDWEQDTKTLNSQSVGLFSLLIKSLKNNLGLAKFILSCVLIFPLVYQSLCGFSRKKDWAWFFHVVACEITLWEYGLGTVSSFLSKTEVNRDKWKQ